MAVTCRRCRGRTWIATYRGRTLGRVDAEAVREVAADVMRGQALDGHPGWSSRDGMQLRLDCERLVNGVPFIGAGFTWHCRRCRAGIPER